MIMCTDGIRFEDSKCVEWAMCSAVPGMGEANVGRIYHDRVGFLFLLIPLWLYTQDAQALVTMLLQQPEPTEEGSFIEV
jgi:hypothetical protein